MPVSNYIVQPGDTIGRIAQRFNTDSENISGFRSGNSDLIFPNEVVQIGQSTNTVPASNLGSFGDITFTEPPAPSDPVVPDFDFTQSTNTQDLTSDVLTRLRNERNTILTRGEKETAGLSESKGDLTSIQAELTALRTEAQGISGSVAARNDGRGVTRAGLQTLTSEEVNRNALQQITLAAEGFRLQGNIKKQRDLIADAVALEVGPIERSIEIQEANLKTIQTRYKNESDAYSKRVTADAKAATTALETEKDRLAELRRERTEVRLLAGIARSGGAPSDVVATIINGTLKEAIAAGTPYFGLAPGDLADVNTPGGNPPVSSGVDLTGIFDNR